MYGCTHFSPFHPFLFILLGESFESLKFLYRIPTQTIEKIVPETCHAIIDVLSSDYLKVNLKLNNKQET